MGTTPTPDRPGERTPAGRPPTAPHSTRPYHEGGVHRWSEVDGDERRGYTMTCADCDIPAWGGTPEMAKTRAQQMDRRRFERTRQGRPPESIAAPELAPLVRDGGMGRGL